MAKKFPVKCSDCGVDFEVSYNTYSKERTVYYCPKCKFKGDRNPNFATTKPRQCDIKFDLTCTDCGKDFTMSKIRSNKRYEKYGRHLCMKCSRKGELNPFFGRKFSEEKLQEFSELRKAFYDDPILGKQRRNEQSERWSGENNPMYNAADLKPEPLRWRYKTFRRKVLERDGFICQKCKEDFFEENLEAHHINSVDWDLHGRRDTKNGICLCKKCHLEFHRIYGKGNNTEQQLTEWFQQEGSETMPTGSRRQVASKRGA